MANGPSAASGRHRRRGFDCRFMARGSFSIAVTAAGGKCSSFPAARSGRRGTRAHGRYPRESSDPNEDPLAAAHREFKEETGFEVGVEFHDLGIFRQPSGKLLHIWAVEGDCDPSNLVNNSFEMALPPKSGRMESFPEIDRGSRLQRVEALAKIVRGQRPILEKLYSDFTR
jgi:predicted NUDIX family NTP pyrophosphohydrolase